ncbi:MAG: hypothetical protein CBC83_00585 [Flavobacteriales bacterium TMED123]|nr:MAG: hypothetical protein CBC83_00585 [Flavobacteriales bacterium TMED123]
MPRSKKQVEATPEENVIPLRRAKRIHSELKKIRDNAETKIDCSFECSDPDTLDSEITETLTKANSEETYLMELDKVFSKLDHSIYKANGECGINVIVSEDARLKRTIQRLERSLRGRPHKGRDHLKTLLTKQIERYEKRSDRYDREPEIQCSVFSEQEVAEKKIQLKELRAITRNIKDKLLELNVKTLIELEDSEVAFLKEERLLG